MRKAIRITAMAMNALVLAPYALFVVGVAFTGDYDPWPTAGWGGLYLLAAASAVVALLVRQRDRFRFVTAGASSILQVILIARGVFEVIDKPGLATWTEHVLLSGPIVLVPLMTLAALMFRERSDSDSDCALSANSHSPS